MTIPNSVTTIGSYTFYNCTGLTSVTIPNSVTTIEPYTFYNCSGLTSVTISGSVTSIGESAFSQCGSLTSVTIPNSVTSIADGAFAGCGLTSVTIPGSVTKIGGRAFYGCSSLTSVTVKNPVPVPISEDVFSNYANATLYVPAGCRAVYRLADYWSAFMKIISEDSSPTINFADVKVKNKCVANWDTSGDGQLSEDEAAAVTDLGNVFKENTTITSFNELQYFTGVTSINSSAFYNCTDLTSVVIPNSVTTIRESAFMNCTNLTSVIIPNSVTSIGNRAFGLCGSLTSVIIPNSVKSIGNYAFKNCTGLTSVTIPDSVITIGESAFENCTGLTSVTIPNSVITIGESAFENCTGLTSVTILNGVKTIGSSAFYNCTGLTSVTIPNSVIWIEESAFEKCTDLRSVTIGNSVTWIQKRAFENCTRLTSATIPNSVTSIDERAFRGCSNLISITIPNSVTSIGNWAFERCSLYSVTVENPEPVTITEGVFSNRKYATLYVPYGCKVAYKAANYWKDFKSIEEMGNPSLINFADDNVKALCVANWDANGDGELSKDEAAAVKDLGMVFKGNTSITSFEELKYFTGLTEIGTGAFNTCTNLTSVVIPKNVTCIGSSAFNTCYRLTSVTIPEGVKTIKAAAFLDCLGLTAIHIPASVTDIDILAFNVQGYNSSSVLAVRDCITVADGNTKYDSRENCNAIIETATNTLLYGCAKTTIPSSVTAISSGAFTNSTITSIVIPQSVESMNGAFNQCFYLTSVTMMKEMPITINVYTFSNRANATLYVPAGSKAAYEAADCWKEFKEIIEMEAPYPAIVLGDANGDDDVNVSDIVEIVNYIMGKPSANFVQAAADLNGDGETNVTDIVKVVSIIMSANSNGASVRAYVTDMADNDRLTLSVDDDNVFSLCLDNEVQYVASEFDLRLSEEQKLESISLNGNRSDGHMITYTKTGDNLYKVLVYSLNNEAFAGNSGQLIDFNVTGHGNMSIENIILVTAGHQEKRFAPLGNGTTGIGCTEELRVKSEELATSQWYTLDGRKLNKQSSKKGIYINNGKKLVIK